MTENLRQEYWLPAWVVRARQSQAEDPATIRLRRASVSAGAIQAPARRDPRALASGDRQLPPLAANFTAPPGETRPFSALPLGGPRQMALRRISEFRWGGAARGIGGAMVPRVSADGHILWLVSGSARIELPRQHRMLRSGDLVLIPAGTAWSLWHGPQAEGVALNLPGAILRRAGVNLPRELISGLPDPEDLPALHAVLPRLAQIGAITDKTSRTAAQVQLTTLARALSRLSDEPPQTHFAAENPQQAKPLTDRYLQLVRRDMGRGITLADFAQELGVTSAVLDRACLAIRGRSALDLLYDARLERAVALLRAGNGSLTEIAALTGYVSPAHMARAFVAATGRGPEAFRRLRE